MSPSPAIGMCTAMTRYDIALRRLSKIRRPRRIVRTIDPKSSSIRTIDAGLARHVGPASAHRDADMGGLERGASFTPSPVIATISPDLQRLHDAQFLLGQHAREHRRCLGRGRQAPHRRVRQPGPAHDIDRRARPAFRAIAYAGGRVVAGDHDHADAGGAALAHRRRHRSDARDPQTRPGRETRKGCHAASAGGAPASTAFATPSTRIP